MPEGTDHAADVDSGIEARRPDANGGDRRRRDPIRRERSRTELFFLSIQQAKRSDASRPDRTRMEATRMDANGGERKRTGIFFDSSIDISL